MPPMAVGDHGLQRFVDAQSGGVYERALAELRTGRKSGHWMWFIFPQVAGLGRSEMSQRYAIASLQEARAYVAHPVLGPRLRQAAMALLQVKGDSAERVLGPIDATKLRSSMTLFGRAAPEEPVFPAVLAMYFDDTQDEATLERLG